jgi:hypothetical protein
MTFNDGSVNSMMGSMPSFLGRSLPSNGSKLLSITRRNGNNKFPSGSEASTDEPACVCETPLLICNRYGHTRGQPLVGGE